MMLRIQVRLTQVYIMRMDRSRDRVVTRRITRSPLNNARETAELPNASATSSSSDL